MRKLKVAILEDDPRLLLDLEYMVEELGLADIVAKSQNSSDFITLVETKKPEALFLDIDLLGDTMSGIDVCNRLNLPTLFISGKTKENLEKIEDLKIYNKHPIDFLSKPVREERLKRVFEKFIEQIQYFQKSNFLKVKLRNGITEKIKQSDIIYIESIPNSTSNSKNIFTKNSINPLEISKMGMDDFFEIGLSKENFIKTYQSYIVNKDYLNLTTLKKGDNLAEIKFQIDAKEYTKKISLSREFLQKIRKY